MNSENRNPRWKNAGLWVLSILMAAMFLFAGLTKLMGAEMHVVNFDRWGYPLTFMYVVGLIEVAGALLLLIPRLASYAALLLSVNMLGANLTHIAAGEYTMLVMPLMLLAFLVVVAWGRWPRLALPGFLRMRTPA
jgi:uncharacterized membrane protein YphA (DoxX/SURF4 family)